MRSIHTLTLMLCFSRLFLQLLFAAVITLLFTLPLAQADNLAALTIIPAGSEQFDISTGLTTLPEGGEVIDAKRKLNLRSGFMRYEENKFIETQDAVVTGKFGTLRAETLTIDLEKNVIAASGELSLESTSMLVTAQALDLFLDADVARLQGEVSSLSPEFQAQTLLLKLNEPGALIMSPYQVQNGPLILTQKNSGHLLQLHQEKVGETYIYNPSTEVEASLLNAFAAFMP